MTKSYDVYFGEIDGTKCVPGQEGETRLGETKTYSHGYGSRHYALLTEKDGQYFVRKYELKPVLDRMGEDRYDPDKLYVHVDHTFTDYSEAAGKLDEIARNLDEQHMDALLYAKRRLEDYSKFEPNKKKAGAYAGFQNLERKRVIYDFIGNVIRAPFKLLNHFADANKKMDDARDWVIQEAAHVRVIADHAIHLDENDTQRRMGAMIDGIIKYETDPNHRVVVDYFQGIRNSGPALDKI